MPAPGGDGSGPSATGATPDVSTSRDSAKRARRSTRQDTSEPGDTVGAPATVPAKEMSTPTPAARRRTPKTAPPARATESPGTVEAVTDQPAPSEPHPHTPKKAKKAKASKATDEPPKKQKKARKSGPADIDFGILDVAVDVTVDAQVESSRRPAARRRGTTAVSEDGAGGVPTSKRRRAGEPDPGPPLAPPSPGTLAPALPALEAAAALLARELGAPAPMPAAHAPLVTGVASGTPEGEPSDAVPDAHVSPAPVATPVRVADSGATPPAEPTPAHAPPHVPTLAARDGRPVTVVHLAAEVAPVARTGGLGEVVTSLAAYQTAAGIRACIVMPLYRQARERVRGALEPVGEPWTTHVAFRDEWSRLWKLADDDAPAVLGGHGARGTPALYFLENAHWFDRAGIYGEQGRDYPDNHRRWAHFCAAALRALPRIAGDGQVILHAHDWHAALALAYLRTWYADVPWFRDIATVLTVHNAGYQGHYGADMLGDFGLGPEQWRYDRFEWYGQVNLLKGGLAYADAATTVSANHATELRTPGGGFGLHATFTSMGGRFVGIANGIDQSRWNPATDPLIPARFHAGDLAGKGECRRALQQALGLPVRGDVPIFVMTARLVTQKGLSLVIDTPGLFDVDAQWVFLGAGERRFEEALRAIARRRPDRVVVDTNFSDAKEHVLMAAGDVCLMPCQYEPCGLTQMRAQRYGTLPLVRRVGGLADTVADGVTGFAFDAFDTGAFAHAVRRAVGTFHDSPTWHRMMLAAMARDFDWGRSEERYRALYRAVLAAR